ncbi:hypothetical protein Lalb_Chr01g0011571 [Lupinus albus]|uniref:Knottin, scorpion toxin n=1 Tax=Lupinus albus TaxID=3870 RepID=A0A6A4R6U2_LUPAL|nr:hypothetical protein Lalb_Chr01g0011571 [Lupinus albus]
MAFGIYQQFFIGILCIALVLASGPAVISANPSTDCIGVCIGIKDCDSNCIKMGYKKGVICNLHSCCCKVGQTTLDN